MREIYRSPWFRLGKYLACSVIYEDGHRRTVLAHREAVEKSIGRELLRDEVVHHRDGNGANNALDNLEIKTIQSHSRDHARRVEPLSLVCIGCGKTFYRKPCIERHNRKSGKNGPFCGRHCSGAYGAKLTPRKYPADGSGVPHGTLSGYDYWHCRCDRCRKENADKKRSQRAGNRKTGRS